MNTKRLKLPNSVCVLSDEAKELFLLLSDLARKHNQDDVADDLNFFVESWFYDAEKIREDAPNYSNAIDKFLVERPLPPVKFLETLGEGLIDENGNKIYLKSDA